MKTKIADLFHDFFNGEKNGAIVLIACTVVSILLANSSMGDKYVAFWQRTLDLSFFGIDLKHSLADWINDGLMTVFFLLVGLEIERELYKGELSNFRNALLPIVAAFGGMAVPALIHFSLNIGRPTQSGFGIPMATDIAFSLGVLSLLGSRIPLSLKILLTAFAIIDDLGAIVVIAFFYVHEFSLISFSVAMVIFVALLTLNRLGVDNLLWYTLLGVAMWFFMSKSGVHATITGVFLAFAIPFRRGNEFSPSYKMQRFLDRPVPFLVLPVFALANTNVQFASGWYSSLIDHNTLGIIAGLLLGKPLGIVAFCFIAVKTGLCRLPDKADWRHIASIGVLGGIGFTMSIFITNLAFNEPDLIQDSKIAILSASSAAGVIGYFCLSLRVKLQK